MSSQDWMRHDHQPAPPPERQHHEQMIWRLTKDSRIAEVRIRHDDHGRELRLLVNGELLWSERERPGVHLYTLADTKLTEFQERGWSTVSPPDDDMPR